MKKSFSFLLVLLMIGMASAQQNLSIGDDYTYLVRNSSGSPIDGAYVGIDIYKGSTPFAINAIMDEIGKGLYSYYLSNDYGAGSYDVNGYANKTIDGDLWQSWFDDNFDVLKTAENYADKEIRGIISGKLETYGSGIFGDAWTSIKGLKNQATTGFGMVFNFYKTLFDLIALILKYLAVLIILIPFVFELCVLLYAFSGSRNFLDAMYKFMSLNYNFLCIIINFILGIYGLLFSLIGLIVNIILGIAQVIAEAIPL